MNIEEAKEISRMGWPENQKAQRQHDAVDWLICEVERLTELLKPNHAALPVKRYCMVAGVEHESANGRWVEYEDVKHLISEPCDGCDSAPVDCIGSEECDRLKS